VKDRTTKEMGKKGEKNSSHKISHWYLTAIRGGVDIFIFYGMMVAGSW
jgi:hypothetical protein